MTAENPAPVPQGLAPKALGPVGLGPLGLGPWGSAPVGQVRIYLGSAHRFIWPVHLAGWLELGWTIEQPKAEQPKAEQPKAEQPKAEVTVKKRRSSSSDPIGASPEASTAKVLVEPLPIQVTDFMVETPTEGF